MVRTLLKISMNRHTDHRGSAGRRRERQSESTERSAALGPSGVSAGKDRAKTTFPRPCFFFKDESTWPAQNSFQIKVGYREKGCFFSVVPFMQVWRLCQGTAHNFPSLYVFQGNLSNQPLGCCFWSNAIVVLQKSFWGLLFLSAEWLWSDFSDFCWRLSPTVSAD